MCVIPGLVLQDAVLVLVLQDGVHGSDVHSQFQAAESQQLAETDSS